tara:strand:- start:587 stop:1030 length:444 start_codon:yes stop_codon:yes gene_type:complete
VVDDARQVDLAGHRHRVARGALGDALVAAAVEEAGVAASRARANRARLQLFGAREVGLDRLLDAHASPIIVIVEGVLSVGNVVARGVDARLRHRLVGAQRRAARVGAREVVDRLRERGTARLVKGGHVGSAQRGLDGQHVVATYLRK